MIDGVRIILDLGCFGISQTAVDTRSDFRMDRINQNAPDHRGHIIPVRTNRNAREKDLAYFSLLILYHWFGITNERCLGTNGPRTKPKCTRRFIAIPSSISCIKSLCVRQLSILIIRGRASSSVRPNQLLFLNRGSFGSDFESATQSLQKDNG